MAGRWFTDVRREALSFAMARGGYLVYVDVPLRHARQWHVFGEAGEPGYFKIPQSYANTAERLVRQTPPPAAGTLRLYRGEWPSEHERRLRRRLLSRTRCAQ